MQTSTKAKRGTAWLVALFFIALMALGLLTSADYGQPWDEPWEQDILRLNGNQYAQQLGLSERFTLTSSMPAPASGMIEESVERDHGECAYYPMLWLMADQTLTPMQRMTVWHAYTWLLFMAGAVALWCIARRLGLSRLLSGAAVLCLMLTPRMFAEGHYNNKDVVLMVLTLLTLWLSLRLSEKPTPGRALLFSLAGAMAANTKIMGLLVWGLCAVFVLIRQCAGRRMNGRAWLAAAVALLSFAGFYFLLTPAMWNDPLGYLQYVVQSAMDFTRWQNFVLFRGSVIHLKVRPLPRIYLPYMILTTTPLWVLLLLVVGQVLAIARWLRRGTKPAQDDAAMALLLCSLLWIVPLVYAVVGQPTMYNGWRHFYFLYGPMLVLAAYGLGRLAAWLRARRSKALLRVAAALLVLCMGMSGAQMAVSHARQYTYYNELVRRDTLPDDLELDYWNVSTLETLRALLKTMPAVQEKPASICGSEFWSHDGLKSALALLPAEQQARFRLIPEGSRGADYVVANRSYMVIGHWKPAANQTPVVVTESFGVPICTVYQRNVSP